MFDSVRLALSCRPHQCTAVETLEGLRDGEEGALGEGGDDEGGGGTQVLVVVEEGVGELLHVARAELEVRRHGRLGSRQVWWLF